MVDSPEGILPYSSLGVGLNHGCSHGNWSGDCPLCGADGKFSVEENSGMFRCWSCEAKGNAQLFVEQLWTVLDAGTKSYTTLANEWRLQPDTLMQWGLCWNPMNSCWYCPGFNESGSIRNLYRYAKANGKNRLMGTTGLSQQMYGVNLYDRKKEHVILAEGAKDAMTLWEYMGQCRWDDSNKLVRTASSANLLSDASVIGLPGCTSWYPKWGKLLAGKIVTFMFDNDHDREHKETGKRIPSGALDGVKRIIESLAGKGNQPKEIHYIRWGDEQEYFTRELPHGYDITDTIHKH